MSSKMPLKGVLKVTKDFERYQPVQSKKRRFKEGKPVERKSLVIGCCSVSAMAICPGPWLNDVEEFTTEFSGDPDKSPFAFFRESNLHSEFAQISRWKLASLLIADLFNECCFLAEEGNSALDVTILTTPTVGDSLDCSVGSFPEQQRSLLLALQRMTSWKPESLATKCNLNSAGKFALTKATMSKPLDFFLFFFEVTSVFNNIVEVKNCIKDLTKTISCHFILFDHPSSSNNSDTVICFLTDLIRDTSSKLTICRSPMDCIDLPKELARKYLLKKSTELIVVDRPNAIELVFGSFPAAQVLIRRRVFESPDDYVKPYGSESIEIIGFITSQDHDINGFGIKRHYSVLNAYEQPCYKQRVEKYDPKCVSNTDILLKLLCDSLGNTESLALCTLINPKRADNPTYCVLYVNEEDPSMMSLAVLPSGAGSESWKDRLSWISSVQEETPKMAGYKSALVPGPVWMDEYSLSKSTSNMLTRIIDTNSVVKFNTEMDHLLDHAAVIAHSPEWMPVMLKNLVTRAKSIEMTKAISKWIKELEELEI